MSTSPRYPGRPHAAVAVAVAAALPAVAGGVLQVASATPLTSDVLFLVVDVMVGLVYGAVAAVILSRRSHPVAWLVALTAVGGGLSAFGGGWASYALSHGAPGEMLAISMFGSAWVPGTLSLFLVVPWLVRETPLDGASRAGVAVGALTAAALSAQRIAAPMTDNSGLLVAVVLVGLGTAAAVLWRRRRGPSAERAGLGLLAAGTALMALSFLPLLLLPYTEAGILLLVPLSHLACQALFPGALLATMLRNRLWGIDLAVSRTVLAGLLTLGMALVYAALVWTATAVVGSSTVAQVVAAVGVVVAVQPVRRRLGTQVHQLVYGDGASPDRVARRIGASLSAADAAELLDQLAAAVGESLRLESVTLTLPGGDGSSGRWGTPSSPPVHRTVHQGEDESGPPLAELALTAPPGERLDRRTLEALAALQPVLAVGLGLVRATRDVVRARDAATHARLAERRLIRRELHDGIGPWLAGLRLGLQAARNVLRTDPSAADAVLATLQDEVAQRVEDVRLLSRSLLPPVLEERGLAAALTQLVSRHAEAGFAVELTGLPAEDPDALRGLDQRVTAAAYAVVSEAVLNAARHSGARGCVVDVSLSHPPDDGAPGVLLVTCRDEGSGRAAGATDGVGSRSMRERTDELGGTLEIRPVVGGGTLVSARLPLAPVVVPA